MNRYFLCILILFNSLFYMEKSYCDSICDNDSVKKFICNMTLKYNFDEKYLTTLFNKHEPSSAILSKMNNVAESESWDIYKRRFINGIYIKRGVNFWRNNNDALNKASRTYGIPVEIIVAIIGIESNYGENTGRHSSLNSLLTLAFYYPKRSFFFKNELENLLLICRKYNLDINSINGSYAGAIGIAQFMPSSYMHYAVSGCGSENIDLINNANDAIFSVSNYLKCNGWIRGKGVMHKIGYLNDIGVDYIDKLNINKTAPSLSIYDLNSLGIYILKIKKMKCDNDDFNNNTLFSLLRFSIDDRYTYWIGEANFNVIMKYNRSLNYAMSVYSLSEKIKKAIILKCNN